MSHIEVLPAQEPEMPKVNLSRFSVYGALLGICFSALGCSFGIRQIYENAYAHQVSLAGDAVVYVTFSGGKATWSQPSPAFIAGFNSIALSAEMERSWQTLPDDPPPRSVLIGPSVYQVKYKYMWSLGETDREHSVIYLRNDLSPSQLRETLLHEIFHGCIGVGNWYGTRTEDEDVNIESVAPVLLMVLRDNPELVRWLAKKEGAHR